jgi:hypothetical protein
MCDKESNEYDYGQSIEDVDDSAYFNGKWMMEYRTAGVCHFTYRTRFEEVLSH